MNRLGIGIAMLAALISSSCLATYGHSGSELDVMSFNIRYENEGDAEDHWDLRKELVYGVIRRRGPDVVGLQEALESQMQDLREAFPEYQFIGQGRRGGAKGEYSALMIRKYSLEMRRMGEFWLSETPEVIGSRGWDAALPRMCTWAVLRLRVTGDEFLVMNTHFDHRGETARLESAAVIADQSVQISGLPTILMGDFNAPEGSGPIERLVEAGFVDTFSLKHPRAKERGTFHGFDGKTERGKIDYVFIDSNWLVL
ncbi:MAG: endonuclease/exonuclease/phosphatase family protein, partial [Planctomycetota bacterium]